MRSEAIVPCCELKKPLKPLRFEGFCFSRKPIYFLGSMQNFVRKRASNQ